MAALALPIASKVEVALSADLTAPEQTWAYTELLHNGETRLKNVDPVLIQRGQADEAGQLTPASWQGLLENSDGGLTPRHPLATTPLRRGMPLRHSIKAGLPYLLLSGAAGSRLGTSDAVSLDITTDWAIAAEVEAPVYLPPAAVNYELTGKFNTTGNQRSVLLFVSSDGTLRLRWSTDGTAAGERTAVSTVAAPRPIVGTVCYAVWLDVNDGAGGHKVRFYAAPTLAALIASPSTWQLGADTNSGVAGTTVVFASTATLDIGDVTGSGFSPFPGRVRKAQYRAGDFATGVIQGQPDITAQADGATSFSDGIRTWTVNAPAAIQRWQTRFLGQITDIKPTWSFGDIDGLARAKVEAAGMLQALQRNEAPLQSALYRTITAPINTSHVHAHLPLEDGRNATQIFSPVGGEPGGVLTANLASDDTLDSSKPLPSVGGGQSYGWNLPVSPTAPAAGWAGTWFLKLNVQPTGGETLDQRIDTIGGTTTQWVLRMDSGGYILFAKDTDNANVLSAATGSASQMYGNWMIVTLFLTQSGANVDWQVDMTPLAGPGVGFSVGSSGTLAGFTLGTAARFRGLGTAPGDGFSFGHFMITSGVATGWLAPGDRAYVGENAGNRIARLFREQGMPYVIEGDPNDTEQMGPQRPLKLTELVGECAAGDLGLFSELPNTRGFGYRCRNDLINQTSAFTVDADLNLGIPFEADEDDQRLVNDFTAQRTDGSSYQAIDQDHIVDEGHYPDGDEVNVAADWQLPYYAGRRLHLGTWPEMRYPGVPVNMVADSAMHDAWLHADLGDVFSATNLPDEHPTPTTDVMLEGYAETISADTWEVSLDNGPAGPWNAGIVEDAVLGRADTEGSELAVGVTNSATSWSVATTEWPPWISTAAGGAFPYGLTAAGEEVTVSAVADLLVTFGAVGTVTHGNNASVTPGAPAGVVTGSLLLILAAIRNIGAGTVNVPTGWERLPLFGATENVALLGRIAQSNGEAMPLITFSGGVANADTSAQCARFGGTFYDVANLPVSWGRFGSLSSQDITYPATRVLYANSLALYVGWKSDDWTSVATIAGATEIGEPSTTTGDDQGIVWDYLIQTTAADIASGSFVVTGGATGVTIGGVIVLHPDVQTFTVARSANGVVKAQTAGTELQLADPMTAA